MKVLTCRNSKTFFSYVNKKLYQSHVISKLQLDDGTCIFDEGEIANIFSTEFCKNYSSERVNISNLLFPNRTSNFGKDPVFDITSVYAALLRSSNSAAGPDHLPGRFFRVLAAEVAPSLLIIFQQSFLSGRIPDMWRIALVRPIFKKGLREIAANYRPVSLTCVVSKIMESIVRDAMYSHLKDNNLLNNAQHGFRERRSTVSSLLLSYHHYIENIENKSDIDILFFDFAKVFDAVNHDLLLLKLNAYGFSKYLLSWIANFLMDRKQFVCIGTKVSNVKPVQSGVIQGSIIGVLLFLLFINDLPDVVRTSNVLLYADDLKLFKVIKSLLDRLALQTDIDRILDWSIAWCLPLSFDKLVYLHLGLRFPDYVYNCGLHAIKQMSSVKDLDVVFCNNVNFRNHYESMCKKANSLCALIFRSFESLDPSFLISLFNVYVKPVLEYCSCVWSPHLKKDIDMIERVQRKFTKRIPTLHNLSYNDRLAYLNIQSLEHRRLYIDIVTLYKIVHGFINVNIHDIGISPVTQHSLRKYGLGLKVVKPLTSLRMFSFANRSYKLWNLLPKNIVLLPIGKFKNYVHNCDLVKLYHTGH